MTPEFTITDTCPWHLREMAEAMTHDSKEIAENMGYTPLKALWKSYRGSIICKTAHINGEIAAIWGLEGAVFSDVGHPWLIVAPSVEDYPFRTAFIYRRQLNEFNDMFPILQDWVPETNVKSMRLLEIMGFKISKNKTMVGDIVYRLAERRAA